MFANVVVGFSFGLVAVFAADYNVNDLCSERLHPIPVHCQKYLLHANNNDGYVIGASTVQSGDDASCGELRSEYDNECGNRRVGTVGEEDSEFCVAYRNVCFSKIPELEAKYSASVRRSISQVQDEVVLESKEASESFIEFCSKYKQKFLYVCPDPLRFGERAVVFCPIYSERCHLSAPARPVPPTEEPPEFDGLGANREQLRENIRRLCDQNRFFANTYCSITSTAARFSREVRESCEKYIQFCLRN